MMSPVVRIAGPSISPAAIRRRSASVFSSGEPVSKTWVKPWAVSHLSELLRCLRRRQLGGAGPLPLAEMDVAVPEAGGHGQAGAVEGVSAERDGHRGARADGGNTAVAEQDGGVSDGRLVGSWVDRGAGEREGGGGLRRSARREQQAGNRERASGG
jgi:hypothetical protein